MEGVCVAWRAQGPYCAALGARKTAAGVQSTATMPRPSSDCGSTCRLRATCRTGRHAHDQRPHPRPHPHPHRLVHGSGRSWAGRAPGRPWGGRWAAEIALGGSRHGGQAKASSPSPRLRLGAAAAAAAAANRHRHMRRPTAKPLALPETSGGVVLSRPAFMTRPPMHARRLCSFQPHSQ